jgi:glycosyltransferase involved in cell wall biosynthesis
MHRTTAKMRVLLLGDARQVHLQRWEIYLRDSGYDVFTASLESVDEIGGPSSRIHIPALLPHFLRYPMAVPAVRRIVKRFEPDLVNAHFLPNYGVIAALSGFVPWVLSTWGSDIMVLPEKTAFHMYRTRRVIQSASYITSDADVMTTKLVELGASPERVVTFPFGVDRSVFHPPSARDDTSGLRILSNRKLEAVYNIETIIAAFPKVLKREPSAMLTIAGTGDRKGSLSAMAARTTPAKTVHFAGHVAHDDMPDVLRRHDIYVSPTLSDTTSVSLLEAMACGLFPVVSDLPANHEWIEHGKNGYLIPGRDAGRLAEAVIEAWQNGGLRRAAAETNARIIAERADWRRNMAALSGLFDRILDQPSAPDLA